MKFLLSTQFVNNEVPKFRVGAQFQTIRSFFQDPEGWVFEFNFYPPLFEGAESTLTLWTTYNPDGALFVDLSRETFKNLKAQLALKARKSPIENYLKSHFINQRIANLQICKTETGESALEFEFLESKKRIRFGVGTAKGFLVVECPDSLPKPFRNRLLLARFPELQGSIQNSQNQTALKPDSTGQKWEKLLATVKVDEQSSKEELDFWNPILEALKTHPQDDMDFRDFKKNVYMTKLFKNKVPDNLNNPQKKSILEKIFLHSDKLKLKISGAQKRQNQLLEMGPEKYFLLKKSASKNLTSASPHQESPESQAKPNKKPGLWVFVENLQIWARVGRTANENSELFRQAQAQDLWFHIKGYPGAHVWIPRGQKNFGAKALVTPEIIEAGCRLALLNSRTKQGPRDSGEIEYTERVHLKAVKGNESKGTLLVQRSKTRFISLAKPLK